jgi:hypothetical protein
MMQLVRIEAMDQVVDRWMDDVGAQKKEEN